MTNLQRLEIVQKAQELWRSNPVYLDTETTGTDTTAEIIEIGIVDSNGSILLEELVKPRGGISADAQRIHGITPQDVAKARPWTEVWPEVEAILKGRPIGAYNSDFDLRLLKQSNKRSWLPWTLEDSQFFCIMKLYARFHGEWDYKRNNFRWHSLEAAGRQSGIRLPNSHRACDDALLARALLEYLSKA